MLSNRKTAPPNRIEQVISLFHQTSPDRNRFHYNCYDNSLYKNRCHNFVCTHSHMHQYSSLGNLPSKKTHNWYYNHQRQHLPAEQFILQSDEQLLVADTPDFVVLFKPENNVFIVLLSFGKLYLYKTRLIMCIL